MDAVRTLADRARLADPAAARRRRSIKSAQDPGYIKGYPPGIRENGGQYTHAAVWVVMALAKLGSGDEAAELFHMLNPVNHARTAADVDALQDRAVRDGRRRLRARRRTPGAAAGAGTRDRPAGCIAPASRASSACAGAATTFIVDPCIPSAWPEYRISWRFLDTRYEITVSNPARRCRGVAEATLDGASVDARAIPLVDDGKTHEVQIVLGGQPSRPVEVHRIMVAPERG